MERETAGAAAAAQEPKQTKAKQSTRTGGTTHKRMRYRGSISDLSAQHLMAASFSFLLLPTSRTPLTRPGTPIQSKSTQLYSTLASFWSPSHFPSFFNLHISSPSLTIFIYPGCTLLSPPPLPPFPPPFYSHHSYPSATTAPYFPSCPPPPLSSPPLPPSPPPPESNLFLASSSWCSCLQALAVVQSRSTSNAGTSGTAHP